MNRNTAVEHSNVWNRTHQLILVWIPHRVLSTWNRVYSCIIVYYFIIFHADNWKPTFALPCTNSKCQITEVYALLQRWFSACPLCILNDSLWDGWGMAKGTRDLKFRAQWDGYAWGLMLQYLHSLLLVDKLKLKVIPHHMAVFKTCETHVCIYVATSPF